MDLRRKQMETELRTNPLGTEKVGSLLRQFAIPSIIAMLVSSLYNIVDQFFIGQKIGELGNAATNIAFPLSTSCTAIALLFGIGGASAFNISLGRSIADEKEKQKAGFYLGNSIVMMGSLGLALMLVTCLSLNQMLMFFGSPAEVLPYASEYTGVVCFGFPLLILGIGGGHLLRADGRPRHTMACNLTGALVNTILDALFVFVFDWGMKGAAAATVIGQGVSAGLAIYFLLHCKTIKLQKKYFRVHWKYVSRVMSLGAAPCSNQIAMMIVQIVMNKSFKYYGGLSVYGEAIPIACAGIISKVNMIFMSFIIGISQGLQPIVSYNYGSGQYDRVKKAFLKASTYGLLLSIIAFLLFQFAPRQIISIFGDGSEEYYTFAIKYFRIFLFFTFINFFQPISSNFYTAIGKPKGGMFLSLTRQIIFLLPLILILPLFFGIDGIMYSGPIADFMAGIVSVIMVGRELMKQQYNISEGVPHSKRTER